HNTRVSHFFRDYCLWHHTVGSTEPLGEQRRTALGEPHVGAALVPREPASGERAVEACPIVGTAASLQKRCVVRLAANSGVRADTPRTPLWANNAHEALCRDGLAPLSDLGLLRPARVRLLIIWRDLPAFTRARCTRGPNCMQRRRG